MTQHAVEAQYVPDLDKPVMRIGAAAELLGGYVRMASIYEERSLVQPVCKNTQCLYSFNDAGRLGRIRELVNVA